MPRFEKRIVWSTTPSTLGINCQEKFGVVKIGTEKVKK